MHRYEELERLYYKKLFIKSFVLFILIFILVFLLFLAYKIIFSQKKTLVKKETKTHVIKKEIKKETKTNKVTLHVINFIVPDVKFEEEMKKKEVKKEVKKHVVKPIKKSKDIVPNGNFIEEKVANISKLIEKFNSNPSLDLAIMIANRYLEDGNLSAAKNWALKANNMAPQDPRSWIIFADILVKQKNVKKAIEILNFYIDSYGKNDKIENKLRSLNDK